MQKKLSIIVPVYNEAAFVIRSLENVVNVEIPNWKKEIIIINDGSTDDTLRLLREFNKKHKLIKIISYAQNLGKGAALKKGIRVAQGEITIIQDGDLEYDPNDYFPILKKYENKNTKVVYGSRILGTKIYHNHSASRLFLLGGLTLTQLMNLMFNTKITDQPTCYKSWRSSLSQKMLKNCQSNGFEFEIEMTAYFAQANEIQEVPIHYYPRTVNYGKKIGLKDFFKSAWYIFLCWFKYRV